MTRIVLLGASGQVGRALVGCLGERELQAPSSRELDLEDAAAIEAFIRRARPELIINAAAYTAVDRAEQESERAYAINAQAPEVMAREARTLGAAFIHYSTDYVFDGKKLAPYTESDAGRPLNTYGRSKLAGDEAVRVQGGAFLIFRTSWVYSHSGHNFLLTMRRLLRERSELSVVDDQVGAPTPAREIAAATAQVVAAGAGDPIGYIRARSGLYNLTCGGETSWFGFAQAIRELMAAKEAGLARLRPISTEEYPTPACRPRYSVLDSSRLQAQFGITLPNWRQSLAQVWQDLEGQ